MATRSDLIDTQIDSEDHSSGEKVRASIHRDPTARGGHPVTQNPDSSSIQKLHTRKASGKLSREELRELETIINRTVRRELHDAFKDFRIEIVRNFRDEMDHLRSDHKRDIKDIIDERFESEEEDELSIEEKESRHFDVPRDNPSMIRDLYREVETLRQQVYQLQQLIPNYVSTRPSMDRAGDVSTGPSVGRAGDVSTEPSVNPAGGFNSTSEINAVSSPSTDQGTRINSNETRGLNPSGVLTDRGGPMPSEDSSDDDDDLSWRAALQDRKHRYRAYILQHPDQIPEGDYVVVIDQNPAIQNYPTYDEAINAAQRQATSGSWSCIQHWRNQKSERRLLHSESQVIADVTSTSDLDLKVSATESKANFATPFDQQDRLAYIPVRIRDTDRSNTITWNFIVDTGATRCSITPLALKKLGFPILYDKKHKKLKVKPLQKHIIDEVSTITSSDIAEETVLINLEFQIGEMPFVKVGAGLIISGRAATDPDWLELCDRLKKPYDQLSSKEKHRLEEQFHQIKTSRSPTAQDLPECEDLLIGQDLLQRYKHTWIKDQSLVFELTH